VCGVAAIYAYRDAPVDGDELEALGAALAHRGPDGHGVWLDEGGWVGLAHRRLSIIDLSDRGAQPMASGDGALVVSFNGEIYNYRALRADLERRGTAFRSESDTEVLLHLYAELGDRMVERLRGMYAFILVDRQRRRILLARDPYGIKPLYYADDGRCVRIASEVKALAAIGAASTVSPAGAAGFLLLGSVPEPHTWYEEVRAVPAGHTLWLGCSGPEHSRSFASVPRVWREAVAREDVGRHAREELVREAVRDSVRHHLVADVPVGAFLSSGVDSSALVAMIREAQGNVRTVTITTEPFRGTDLDEAPLAEQVASAYGAVHETHVVTMGDFELFAPRILAAMDQPSVDGINTWLVSRAAVSAGLKVAVSGLGGDELFGGYPSFDDVPRWNKLARWPARVPGAGRALRQVLALTDAPSRLGFSPKIASVIEYGETVAGAYFLRRGLFMPWELPSLMGDAMAREGLRRFDAIAGLEETLSPPPKSDFARVAALEAAHYMRNQLLRDTDWASMAHGLEVRVPLVDFTLLKEVAPMASALRGREGKRVLARCPDVALPPTIVDRPKTGFSLPMARWLGEASVGLDAWKSVPSLRRRGCHWSRRLAYSLFVNRSS
jgi:asparagine synthase (glutamine-hydrolysing)